jgi:hypothetical protein
MANLLIAHDGIYDGCDLCPQLPDSKKVSTKDTDGDGVGDPCDNCPTVSNPNQEDRPSGELPDSHRRRFGRGPR